MKAKEPADKVRKISVSIEPDILRAIEAEAKSQRRHRASMINWILAEHLKMTQPKSHDCPASGCGTKKGCTLKTA